MATELFTQYYPNQIDLILGAAVTTAPAAGTSETWSVTVPTGLTLVNPSGIGQYRGIIGTEIVGFTAGIVTPGTQSWTITRGMEGSAITTHANGAVLSLDLTAGAAANFVQLDPTAPQAGAIWVGDPNAASVPSFHRFYGNTEFRAVVANDVDSDDVVDIFQNLNLTVDNGTAALTVQRNGPLNGFQYTFGVFYVSDSTVSTAPVAQFVKQGVTQFQVDGDGVQIHGKLKTGAVVTRTSGAANGKMMPIYNEAGVLQGYLPLFD